MAVDSVTKQCIHTLAIQPTLTYGVNAIPLTNTDLQAMERKHARMIKNSLDLSKFSRTSPLLAVLNKQRMESVIKVQTLNLFTRSISRFSLASTFYWTLHKRGEAGGRDKLMGRAHIIMIQYGLTLTKTLFSDNFSINSKTLIYNRYPHGQNGFIYSLRFILNDYTHCNQCYAKMLPRYYRCFNTAFICITFTNVLLNANVFKLQT